MSLNLEQEKRVRQIIREEFDRYHNLAMMYSAESVNQPQPEPQAIPDVPEHLQKYVVVNGASVKPKEYIHDRGVWEQINDVLRAQGYKWVSDAKNSRWQK